MESKSDETQSKALLDARPPMGPRVATPVAAKEKAAALGHRRLYAHGRPRFPAS